MMQMYTTTKPNQERALYFYEELQKAGVAPTAHTGAVAGTTPGDHVTS
jgi:predicted TIM-barrel fold metal-dependent hydrolase